MTIATREPLAPQSVIRSLPNLEALSKRTSYEPNEDHPFLCREGFETRFNIDDEEIEEAAGQIARMKALRGLKDDPDLAYVQAVARTILDDLAEREVITRAEYDTLEEATRIAAEHGAEFVARRWMASGLKHPLSA